MASGSYDRSSFVSVCVVVQLLRLEGPYCCEVTQAEGVLVLLY